MSLRQTIQAGSAKANELFAKLSETSDAAVKTRAKLFEELKAELELHSDLEEQHLFPLLRKHKETKSLVPDAIRDNKELRVRLAELDELPKDDETFVEKLTELKKGFQRHVRDEKKEFLPAVRKVLSDEEAQDIAEKFEKGIAEAEQAKREQAEQRRLTARIAREQEEQQAAAAEAVERAQEAALRQTQTNVREAAATMEHTVQSAQKGIRQAAENVIVRTQSVANDVLGAAKTYREAARTTAQGLQAVSASRSIAARGTAQIQSTMMEWAGQAIQANVHALGQLMRCRTIQQVAETQRGFLEDTTRRWMEGNARVLQISQRVAEEALQPLESVPDAGDSNQRAGG